jgi:hypothetical protein
MRKFILLAIIGFVLNSCNTRPPTSPEASYPSGKIIATTTINLNQTSTNADKVVLLEDFANISCPPCVTSNQIIESLLHGSYAGKIAVVKFPTNFPSPNDPFFLENASLCTSRIVYYNVLYAPTIVVDGILKPSATDSDEVKEKIDERLVENAPFKITVNTSFQDSSLIVNINVQAINLAGINMADLILYTTVVENDINYEAPNGESVFYNVLRKMLPSDNGLTLQGISNTTLNWETDLFSNWNPDNLHVVAFIQNNQTKEVLQTGSDY